MKRKLIIFVVFAMVLSPLISQGGTHKRDTWYIGFGLGGGDAGYTLNGQDTSFDDYFAGAGWDKSPKAAVNFKVGATLSEKSLLGLDMTGIRQSATAFGVTASLSITNTFLMYTYFPSGEGLFLRLGGGLSTITQEFDSWLGKVSIDESGTGVLGGLGYAFWLGENFNLTVNIDHSEQSYSGDSIADKSDFTIAYLGFDWY